MAWWLKGLTQKRIKFMLAMYEFYAERSKRDVEGRSKRAGVEHLLSGHEQSK